MWTQALHWLAVLVTMNIMLLSGVQQLLPTLATILVLLILLALGTFLAGVHLRSLQIGFLGLALALAVPAISWVKQSALFLFWLRCSRRARHGVLVILGRYSSSGRASAFPDQAKAMTGGSRNDQGREMVMKRLIAVAAWDRGYMRGVRRRRKPSAIEA